MYVRIASTMQVVHRHVGFVVFYSQRKGTAFLGNMQEMGSFLTYNCRVIIRYFFQGCLTLLKVGQPFFLVLFSSSQSRRKHGKKTVKRRQKDGKKK